MLIHFRRRIRKLEAKDLQNNRAAGESSSSCPRSAIEETNEIQAAKTAGGIAGSSASSSGGKKNPRRLPRPASVAIRSYHANNACFLDLEESSLASQAAFRGDHLGELRRAAREKNSLIRSDSSDRTTGSSSRRSDGTSTRSSY